MKLRYSEEWLRRKISEDPDDEPTGLLACSPELMAEAEKRAGRKWDGTQEDAEKLLFGNKNDGN